MSEEAAQTRQILRDERVLAYGSMLLKRMKLARAVEAGRISLCVRCSIFLAEGLEEPRRLVPPFLLIEITLTLVDSQGEIREILEY